MTVFDAILSERESGQKLQCSVWESDDLQLFRELNFTQFVNCNVTILGRRLYSPSLKDVGSVNFLIFHTFVSDSFPANRGYPAKITDKCIEN